MIKVLVINTVRFKLNGISAVIKNYYRAMNRENIRMDFLAIDDPSDEYRAFFEENHLKCFVLYKEKLASYFCGIIRLCRREKYDIVHVHGNSANMAVELLAAALGGVRVRIAHSHSTSTMHPRMHEALWPLFSKLCSVRLACGEAAGRWLYRKEAFTVLNNGIETNRYAFSDAIRHAARIELGVKDNEILLGHVGGFIELKNHTFLIDIFGEVHKTNPEFKLLLVSDGMLMPAIKEKVHALGLDEAVLFLGKTMKVQNYLDAMDLFLLPSMYEGLPLVLVEAQASGLSCAVSDAVSKEADLTRTSSYLPIQTVEPWAELIRGKAYLGRNRSDSSRENIARIKAEGYDIEQNADRLRQIYIKSCEGR